MKPVAWRSGRVCVVVIMLALIGLCHSIRGVDWSEHGLYYGEAAHVAVFPTVGFFVGYLIGTTRCSTVKKETSARDLHSVCFLDLSGLTFEQARLSSLSSPMI